MNIAQAVAEAIHSMEMEGFKFTPEEKEMWRKIASGELPLDAARQDAEEFHRKVSRWMKMKKQPREGWAEKLKVMSENGDDDLKDWDDTLDTDLLPSPPKGYWDLTKEEKEAVFAEATKKAIAETHATGRPSTHGDDKGVYHLYPDGRKKYIKRYDE